MIGDIPGFRRALLGHFDRSRRALPWRSERTPYRVMVSEFMLQQTRVETVIPYYERWLRRFPGWEALADAGEDEVLRAWTGLGYYRRARNLHRAARVVRERFGGELPKEPAALKRLPGVGEYTAGAVASIAFGRAVPAVDGNVRRVLCRILDVAAPTAGRLREEAARLVDPGRPGDFNEALMELGATVCTPRAPGCGGCPVRGWWMSGPRTAGAGSWRGWGMGWWWWWVVTPRRPSPFSASVRNRGSWPACGSFRRSSCREMKSPAAYASPLPPTGC